MRRLKINARADREFTEAETWWREHRDKAPNALSEDLAAGLTLIREHPEIGVRVPHAKRGSVRSYTLRRVRYVIYFTFSETEVRVLAL